MSLLSVAFPSAWQDDKGGENMIQIVINFQSVMQMHIIQILMTGLFGRTWAPLKKKIKVRVPANKFFFILIYVAFISYNSVVTGDIYQVKLSMEFKLNLITK